MQATGAQGAAIQILADMIAASSTFRQRVRGEGQHECHKHIHYPYLLDPDQMARPFAVIEQGGVDWNRLADTVMVLSGRLRLKLADDSQMPEAPEEALVEFTNFVDGVLADLAEIAGENDHLAIMAMHCTQEPVASNPTSDGGRQYFWTGYDIVWESVSAGGGE